MMGTKWQVAALALLVAAILPGCRAFGNPEGKAGQASTLRACADLIEIEREGSKHLRPLTAPELVVRGDRIRDEGLFEAGRGAFFGGKDELFAALDCYNRALRLAPEHYGANLGIGVIYLALVRRTDEKPGSEKIRTMLQSSKSSLARAYAIRRGHYEPLYYLAEVAVFEEDYGRARSYLEPIYKTGANAGPVNALLGFMVEKQGGKDEAKPYYEAAVRAGGPVATLCWAAEKVKNDACQGRR